MVHRTKIMRTRDGSTVEAFIDAKQAQGIPVLIHSVVPDHGGGSAWFVLQWYEPETTESPQGKE